ncbi:hypothetical protein IFM89_039930 [Coptis chinensis]|uniref:RRM domain-containing protein n=1 Tax=Coptis chinensis TaxID=261450 RepID=A0A835LA76_9MAGN|nr:hypothetical protein IFM89_039930 [Coptis chinensis]
MDNGEKLNPNNCNNKPLISLDSEEVVERVGAGKEEEEDEESNALLSTRRGGISKRPKKLRRKVQWNDRTGNKLVEILEFEPSRQQNVRVSLINEKGHGDNKILGAKIYGGQDLKKKQTFAVFFFKSCCHQILKKEMDSDEGKLFIGGISWETTEEKLSEYFGNYGQVLQTVVMKDKVTDRPRGFGFVVFADPLVIDRVLQDKHTIDGRTVEAKRALSREEQQTSYRSGARGGDRSFGSGGNLKTKKIFVGGLPPTLTEEGFRQYFEAYGVVTDVVVMFDQNTQRPRGFGFITFDTEEAVDRVLHKSFHDLNGKNVEVKRALPKDANSGGGVQSGGSRGYQGYDSSNAGNGSYNSQMDGSRYMQPQATGGGFAPYGAQGYGYAGTNNAVGYGGYGVGNYGVTGAGYGGPAGGYGNPNVQNTSYGNDPPGSKSSWSGQAPSGYGSAPYGGTGFAAPAQSPSGTAAYGNKDYGYYGGSDGSYENQNSYNAGRGGHANNSGNSVYTSTAWSSDPSQNGNYGTAQASAAAAGQVGYSGGYGAHQPQQGQQ